MTNHAVFLDATAGNGLPRQSTIKTERSLSSRVISKYVSLEVRYEEVEGQGRKQVMRRNSSIPGTLLAELMTNRSLFRRSRQKHLNESARHI
ncbi:hypothetical protein AVEN_232494-1 [Araneus ventricosus]|uniref:Uncharacterized protein n=1 Tax=Araneus ventricosus TaxID=182803 RepID=A0A4Y2H9Q4_ARAVE|nr:hypothetical protein AVEN_232494-1 [Araneus ventricosus]